MKKVSIPVFASIFIATILFGAVLAANSSTPNVFLPTSVLATKVHSVGAPRVAYVDYLFTHAAYTKNTTSLQYDKFYGFYNNNVNASYETPIYTNLQLLTASLNPKQPDILNAGHEEVAFFMNNLTTTSGYPFNFKVINDLDVHKGKIFNSTGQNRYDALILGHNEYMTQKEYNNLKKFVTQNGGTLILLDGNPFIAEVTYNAKTNSVTYLHGHGFEYFPSLGYAIKHKAANYVISTGHLAVEWWYLENSQWLGSNFVEGSVKIPIVNNTFSVPDWEDNAVTNAKATQLVNYQTTGPTYDPNNSSIISTSPIEGYTMKSGHGKIFAYGVFSSLNLTTKNFLEFLNYCIYNSWEMS